MQVPVLAYVDKISSMSQSDLYLRYLTVEFSTYDDIIEIQESGGCSVYVRNLVRSKTRPGRGPARAGRSPKTLNLRPNNCWPNVNMGQYCNKRIATFLDILRSI